jgi:hypothetical protein
MPTQLLHRLSLLSPVPVSPDETVLLAAASTGEAVLPERWEAAEGIAYSRRLAGGRDFTDVEWSWRDPTAMFLPLRLMTVEAPGHEGAVLAGFIDSIENRDGTIWAEGGFLDTEEGRQARDLLVAADGRPFGVSVDPGENTAAEEVCTEEDADGWCVAADMIFDRYEVAGLTMTATQAFEEAGIVLAVPAADDVDVEAVAATADVSYAIAALITPDRPPRSWFETPEPEEGDDLLVDQSAIPGTGRWGVPLKVTDDGQVFGHIAVWGTCHAAFEDVCVTPPSSPSGYARFHTGEVVTAEGDRVASGPMFVGTDHPNRRLFLDAAVDHYAHSGVAFADVRATDGRWGIWVAGSLRPGLSPEQVRVAQGCSPSGDWRSSNRALELCAVLAVNTPGFEVAREVMTASGWTVADAARPAARIEAGQVVSLTAAGRVRRCRTCGGAAAVAAVNSESTRLDRIEEALRVIETTQATILSGQTVVERRTRHLRTIAAAASLDRLRV